jgi:copper chaperone
MTTTTYFVPSIHCMHCVHTIKTELAELAGVSSVDADQQTKKVTITYEEPVTPEKIENLLGEIDFPVEK